MTTCGEAYTEAVLRLVWKYLVPAMKGADEDSEQTERELEQRKASLHIAWPLEHETTPAQTEKLWTELLGKTIVFPENQVSVLAESRVNNGYTSTWTVQHRTGIQSLRLEQTDDGIVLCFEDNCNRGRLPVGDGAEPKRGLLCSLWGDYEVWTAARWLSDGRLCMYILYGKWRILSGIYHEKGERWHRCADLQWSMGQKGWKTGRKEYHCSLLQ